MRLKKKTVWKVGVKFKNLKLTFSLDSFQIYRLIYILVLHLSIPPQLEGLN